MYTYSPNLTSYLDSSSTMTPKPPTVLHTPISGVTNAIGPNLFPSIIVLIDCFKVSLKLGNVSISLKIPNSLESLFLFNQN